MLKFKYYCEMAGKIKSPLIIPKSMNYVKYRAYKKTPIVKHYTPQIVSIALINRCNLSCNYCGFVRDGTFKEPKIEMTLDKIKKAFAHAMLKNCLMADLLGGEPLLCKDFTPIVSFLSSVGCLTNTSTNGLLLEEKIEEVKNAGITRINVSIYPENYEILSGSLRKINKVYRVHASYVLTKSMLEDNPESVFDVIDMVKSSGCKSLRFWMYRALGRNPNYDDVIMEESVAYKEFKAKSLEKHNNFILFPEVVSNSTIKKCAQLWQRANISPDGTLDICCGNAGKIPNVNIFNNDLDEIYNCRRIVEMRKNMLDNSAPPFEACKNCNLLTEAGW